MRFKLGRLGTAAILVASANTAFATWVEGKVYCDANSSGQIEVAEDVELEGVVISALCQGATDPSGTPLASCMEPNDPFTLATTLGRDNLLHVIKTKNVGYDVSIGGPGLPDDARIILPVTVPARFNFPMSETDQFSNPDYRNAYVAKIDWLIDSAACHEPAPAIQICTHVTLDADGRSNFSDADTIVGDVCDRFDQGIPVGVAGSVDGSYRLDVVNTGTETLVDVVIVAPEFGLLGQAIPEECGALEPGEVCSIDVNTPNFSSLKKGQVCTTPGMVTAQAEAQGSGINSGVLVTDADPAIVNCVTEPHLTLRKDVRLNMGEWMDANTPETGPTGAMDSSARYRLVVTNDGTETLSNVLINDATLGLVNVPLGVDPLLPGQKVILGGRKVGFGALRVDDFCDSIGTRLNIAQVAAQGLYSSSAVSASDIAYATCKNPQIELVKQVSIDGEHFFDANLPNAADVPVGLVNVSDVTYRLTVKNIGSEKLVDVLITDQDLGIEQVIGDLSKGEKIVIDYQTTGFEKLKQLEHCTTAGSLQNVANVQAIGEKTEFVVSDDDPAYVKCVSGPSIDVKKQVTLSTRAEFKDADKPRRAPKGVVGDSGRYRFIVKNTGDEPLNNVRVQDAKLRIDKVIGSLAVGEQKTIGIGQDGFGKLRVDNLCDAVGTKLNTVQVTANGTWSNTSTNDDDAAYVKCEPAPVCTVTVDKTCSVSIAGDLRYHQTNADECEIPTSGANVKYSYDIRNTGNTYVTITDITDSKLGNVLKANSRILEAGEKFVRTLKPVFIKNTQSNAVSVNAYTDLGAECQASDILKLISKDKPVAANQTGMVRGDPHYYGGDGGKWDFHGRHLAMFNLLSDTNLNVNTQYVASRPGMNLEKNMYLGNTRVNLYKVGGKAYSVQISVDGSAHINGRALRSGENITLANGTRISYTKNPKDKLLTILPSRGLRTTSAVLKVWTAEGYYIELAGFNAYNRYPSHIDMAVRTSPNGVNNGRMPSGVLGQSFDADSKPLEYKHVNGWSFEVNDLSSRP
jgi:hypothetical protein